MKPKTLGCKIHARSLPFALLLFFACSFRLGAQCNVQSSSLSSGWEVSGTGQSDQALIRIYASSASGCNGASLNLYLGQSLSSDADLSVNFCDGWLTQNGNCGNGYIASGGTKIVAEIQLPSCQFPSGNGLLCEIFIDNQGTPLSLSGLVTGVGTLVLTDELD